jgi:hypothetical protein
MSVCSDSDESNGDEVQLAVREVEPFVRTAVIRSPSLVEITTYDDPRLTFVISYSGAGYSTLHQSNVHHAESLHDLLMAASEQYKSRWTTHLCARLSSLSEFGDSCEEGDEGNGGKQEFL